MSVDGRTDIDRSLAEGLLAMNQNGPDRSGGVSGPPLADLGLRRRDRPASERSTVRSESQPVSRPDGL